MLPYEHNMEDINFCVNQEITTSEIYENHLMKNLLENNDLLIYDNNELDISHFEIHI